MDSISNGLDSATTYDIIRAVSLLNHTIGLTTLVSLLQPPPEVYSLFDEIILLCEGHIIYQGKFLEILENSGKIKGIPLFFLELSNFFITSIIV